MALNNHVGDLTVLMCRRSGCGSAGTSLQVAPKAAVISRLDWEGPASWLTRVAVGRVHFLLDCWTETSAFPSLSCHVGLFTEQVTTWRLASSSEGRGACPREREQARAHASERHGRQSHNLLLLCLRSRSLDPSHRLGRNVCSGMWRKAGDEAGEVGRERGCCPFQPQGVEHIPFCKREVIRAAVGFLLGMLLLVGR